MAFDIVLYIQQMLSRSALINDVRYCYLAVEKASLNRWVYRALKKVDTFLVVLRGASAEQLEALALTIWVF